MKLIDRTDRRLTSVADAYATFVNKEIIDRCLWLPDDIQRSCFTAEQLQGVFAWHHLDLKKHLGSLVKIDFEKGTLRFLDNDKYMQGDGLSLSWGRPYKLESLSYSIQSVLG